MLKIPTPHNARLIHVCKHVTSSQCHPPGPGRRNHRWNFRLYLFPKNVTLHLLSPVLPFSCSYELSKRIQLDILSLLYFLYQNRKVKQNWTLWNTPSNIIKRKEVRTRLVVFTNRQYKRDNGRLSVNKSGSDSNNTPSRCFNDWWRENLGSLVCFFLSFSTHWKMVGVYSKAGRNFNPGNHRIKIYVRV